MDAAEELLQRTEDEYNNLKKQKRNSESSKVSQKRDLHYLQGMVHGIQACMTVFKVEEI